MKMEVEIISTDCIKPSSPTPCHLRNHKLSFLDQHIPHVQIPLVVFYSLDQEENLSRSDINHIVCERLQLLKQSISETLSPFYPLAGKIKDHCTIDCNDEGIYFAEARVDSLLSDFLSHPDIYLMSKFLPSDGTWEPNPGKYVAGVQVTTFACGGIAVGIFVSHMIADGTAFSWFLKSWAARARKNNEEEIHPRFDASSIFPYEDEYPREELLTPAVTSHLKFGKFLTKRFVFDATAIAKLKAEATSSSVQNPTRVEVVTALFAKCFMAALQPKPDTDKPFSLTHAINLRRKASPQFSEYMGNFVWAPPVVCKDAEADLQGLVGQLKQGIAKVNGDFVNCLQGDEGLHNFVEAIKYEREICDGAVDKIQFTSWCNFGLYDLDFGWGKPAWASTVGLNDSVTFYNTIVLMDTRKGDGVEAWASLLEEDIAKLVLDKELLAFATVDPNPLKYDI
ncbi:vinorine synthase-like [Melia azedarach]|uniref:Vinorine synthase-like n=1 Tax=Melia azedarach TaxID=155640 RepID=A0ACC1Y7B8_MELAZ|nr:vinorine synthase-like [Melia azedarach]